MLRFKNQIHQKSIRIQLLEDEGGSSDREKIKMKGIQEQLVEEEAQMSKDLEELQVAKLEL